MLVALLSGCFLMSEEPKEEPKDPLPKLELSDTKDPPKKPTVQKGTYSGPDEPPPAITAEMCEDALEDGGPVGGPGCITADIQCGDVVIGHTVGGSRSFDSEFYDAQHCTPDTTDHDGGDERVYRLRVPGGDRTATVWLDTPCADLDLAGIRWDGDSCPNANSNIRQCDMWPWKGTTREKVRLSSQQATTWLLVVEGKDDQEGPFALHVMCEDGL